MSDQSPPAVSLAADSDLSGRRLGDYQLLRRLGRGGMADVYLAQQQSLGRHVAVKVLKHTLAQDAAYVRRFQNEARAAAALVHASIVQIHEVGCLEGVHFIVQEYVDGQSLRQLLQRQGVLPVAPAVSILRQVAAALHRAAQQKITHRDIKPDNIMLSTTGEVKVADFGLARIDSHDQAQGLTQVGVTMGTPLYMSPEQVEGRPVDVRSDLYSLGVTCYHMLTGRPPFQGDSPLNIAVQQLKNEPEPLANLRPDLPPSLCRIVHKLLAKRPEDRYQTPVELLQELRVLRIADADGAETAAAEEWSTPELLALADARGAATQRLDTVMQTEARVLRRGVPWLAPLAVILGAFLLGGGAAWLTRPAPLLSVSAAELPPVAQLASARDQYLWAAGVGTEAAWRSVGQFFPPGAKEENRYYGLRAEQRLAELFVEQGELGRAEQVYEALSQVDDTQLQFQAIGFAGQATVHMLRGETSLAKQKLAAMVQLLKQLPLRVRSALLQEIHPRLRPELERLLQDVRRGLPSKAAREERT